MRAGLIVLTLLLAGCADVLAERQAFLNGFVGKPEADLVRALGVPTRSTEANGHRFLAYTENRIQVIPSAPAMGWGGWSRPWGYDAFPPDVVQRICETTFEVADGKVVGYTLRGNACG